MRFVSFGSLIQCFALFLFCIVGSVRGNILLFYLGKAIHNQRLFVPRKNINGLVWLGLEGWG